MDTLEAACLREHRAAMMEIREPFEIVVTRAEAESALDRLFPGDAVGAMMALGRAEFKIYGITIRIWDPNELLTANVVS